MRSVINWKVLLGLLIVLTIVFFSLLLGALKNNLDQAQVIINDLNKSAQVAHGNNEKLKLLVDSITSESSHLEARIALLEKQKDSLSKGISRPQAGLISKPVAGNMAQDYYMNCENIVQVDTPQKYARSKLRYSSPGADILETPDHGRIIVIPKQRMVSITVESGGTEISKIELPPVKNVPTATFNVYQDGQKIDLKRGAARKTLSSLTLVAEPDPNFRRAVPKDARYLVKRWELNITRGSSVVLRRVCNSESVDLKAEQSLFRPGDIVRVDVQAAVRLTYSNNETMYPITEGIGILTFPIF